MLAAIRERPADDAPRLVYADWLEEHGSVERAQVIRIGVKARELVRFCLGFSIGDTSILELSHEHHPNGTMNFSIRVACILEPESARQSHP